MRLRQQALIACACLACSGCARLLQTLVAPQSAAMSTASSVANQASAGARQELAGVGREVDRLLAGRPANQEELERIRSELKARLDAADAREGSAQGEPARLRPWHPRAPAEPFRLGPHRSEFDQLGMGLPDAERGLARRGPLPDGIAAGELQTPIDLTPMRILPRR